MKKLISVVIPTYNAEKTIERAVKSVIGDDIEIIIVIDGTTDNTLEICRKIKNNNIKIIEQINKGPFEARKNGIQKAQGKYIMFLDSDDYFCENTIKRVEEVIKKYNEPDLIRFRYRKEPDGYDQYKYIEKDEEEILKEKFPERVYPMFLEGYMLNALWTNCVKKEIFSNINLEECTLKYGEDLLVNLNIFSNIQNIVFINDVLYVYEYQSNSLTNSGGINKLLEKLQDAVKVYTNLYTFIEKWGMLTKDNIEIVNKRIEKETNQLIKILKENME